VGSVVKVHGTMTSAAVRYAGRQRVLRTGDDPAGLLEPWIGRTGNSFAGSRCDIADGFVHPEFPGGQPDKVRPSGAPIDPYNQDVPPGNRPRCQAVART
jgi:hypothetical protein